MLSWTGGSRAWLRGLAMLAVTGLGSLGLVVVAGPAAHAAGGSYVVTSTGDQVDMNPGDGVCLTAALGCTLRAAVAEANKDNGPSSISFLIPGAGVQTINLATALPLFTDTAGGTTIDGYTQPGSSVNTDPLVDNAVLRIELKGPGSGTWDAIDIESPNNVIRGLAFYSFRLSVNMVFGGDNNVIVGNFMGTNAAGTWADTASSGNVFGVVIDRLASNNIIGRPNAADRNVISGNAGRAVMLKDAVKDNVIQNNIIGLSPNGQSRLPNADHGVDVNSGATRTLVGGTGPMEGNLISGNDGHGVEVSHINTTPTEGNQIIGNRIGTDPTGNAGPAYAVNGVRYSHENVHTEDHVTNTVIAYNIIGNSPLGGIKIDSDSINTNVHDNRIGISANGTSIPNGPYGIQVEEGSHGTVIGPNNIITNNRSGIRLQDGVRPDGTTAISVNNTITKNTIYGNSRLGIDIAPLDAVNGADVTSTTNNGMHFPVLSAATATTVTGSTCASCKVEVFLADSTTTDPSVESSYGEGKTFVVDGTADSSGAFTLRFPANSVDRVVTSTATDPAGNTSEFSRNIVIPASTDLVNDSYTRTVTGGWGSADVGGAYTPQSFPTSFAVNGTQGTINAPAGSQRQIDLLGPSVKDVNLSATVATDHQPLNGGHIVSLVARRQSATSQYQVGLRIDATGAVYLRAEAGATLLAETPVALTYADAPIRLRAELTGSSPTTIKIKAWKASGVEPDAWGLTFSDSAPAGPQVAGTTGVRVTSTETGSPVVVSVDDLVVRTASAPK